MARDKKKLDVAADGMLAGNSRTLESSDLKRVIDKDVGSIERGRKEGWERGGESGVEGE